METEDKPGCVQTDQGNEVFEKMIASDAIVMTSPIYCCSFTAQLKPLIDRSICMFVNFMTPEHTSLIAGKKTALLVTCAGPIENNADLIQEEFKRISGFLKANSENLIHVIPGLMEPEDLGDDAKGFVNDFSENLVN